MIPFFNKYSYFIDPCNLHILNTSHNLNIILLHNFLIHDFIYFLTTQLVKTTVRFISIIGDFINFLTDFIDFTNFIRDYFNYWTRIYIPIFTHDVKKERNQVIAKFLMICLSLID